MDEATEKRVKAALLKSWSEKTSVCFSSTAAPSYGQCAQTAIVVQELFGGDILRTEGWHGGRHFYNHIGGKRFDFTAGQFSEMPEYTHDVSYADIPSDAAEATTETMGSQVSELRSAFRKALGHSE